MYNNGLDIDQDNLGFCEGLVVEIHLQMCSEHRGGTMDTITAMNHILDICQHWSCRRKPVKDKSKYFSRGIGIPMGGGGRVPIVSTTINLGSILVTFAPSFAHRNIAQSYQGPFWW
jgi:hypothetical protein